MRTTRSACQHAAMPAPSKMPVISDDLITLRPWASADASLLVAASTDPLIQRYSLSRSRPFSDAEAQDQLRYGSSYRLEQDAFGRPFGSLVIADSVTSLPLGQCGVDGWSPGDVAQIGYWLTPQARGRGIATRAVVRLTNWLFELGASRVFLTVVEDNHASISVARRAGFLLEGPTGEQSVWHGRHHDIVRFAVTAKGWERER